MGFLGKLNSSIVDTVKNIGASIVGKIEGHKGNIRTIEIYQAPGIISRPGKGATLLVLMLNDNPSHLVSVAMNNYVLQFPQNQLKTGAALVYSTDADGAVVKARTLIDNDGKISSSNADEDLKTLIDDLIDTIAAITVNTTTGILNPASIAALNTIKGRFGDLLKEMPT